MIQRIVMQLIIMVKPQSQSLQVPALTKAKAFLKAGGSLDAIKGKYEIPAELLKTL